MIARLEQSFAEAKRFTADASHELRTPLTVIRTETELALEHPPDPSGYEHLLGSILEECLRMGRLTDQLLTLAREDAQFSRNRHGAIDLCQLAADVAAAVRPLAESKGVALVSRTNRSVQVAADVGRLRQVLLNLLDNAIKYTASGGTVEIKVDATDDQAILVVADTGVGIPAEHLPHVFERFYRVDKSRGRDMGGTGLGLSIARSIVVAHGGQIEISSVNGAGTTCKVTLPQCKASKV